MGRLNDQMKTMTLNMKASVTERRDAVARISEETEKLLENAQSFMKQVSGEHQEMADVLRQNLATQRADLQNQVMDLRSQNQEEHRHMGHDLRKRLGKEVNHIEKEVASLMKQCRSTRHHLAVDLRQTSQTWRKFAGH